MPFGVDEDRQGPKWFFRIASLASMAAVFVLIGLSMQKGQTFLACMLVNAVVPLAVLASWRWTGSLLGSIAWAKGYVEGVEGDHRHEWYAFRGQRIRVFLDEARRPWFALNEVAFVLALDVDEKTFRHYGPHEVGTPECATEQCLSETGLRRLLKYSTHADAGALGLWLERDVLRLLRNRQQA